MRIFLLSLITALFSPLFSYSQVSMNVLSKMEEEYDFTTQSIIQRLISSQETKVEQGELSEFEAKCISINIVNMLGNKNADRFIRISEYSMEGKEPSVVDQNFMEEISKRYLNFMRIIVAECSDAEAEIRVATQPTPSLNKDNDHAPQTKD